MRFQSFNGKLRNHNTEIELCINWAGLLYINLSDIAKCEISKDGIEKKENEIEKI